MQLHILLYNYTNYTIIHEKHTKIWPNLVILDISIEILCTFQQSSNVQSLFLRKKIVLQKYSGNYEGQKPYTVANNPCTQCPGNKPWCYANALCRDCPADGVNGCGINCPSRFYLITLILQMYLVVETYLFA